MCGVFWTSRYPWQHETLTQCCFNCWASANDEPPLKHVNASAGKHADHGLSLLWSCFSSSTQYGMLGKRWLNIDMTSQTSYQCWANVLPTLSPSVVPVFCQSLLRSERSRFISISLMRLISDNLAEISGVQVLGTAGHHWPLLTSGHPAAISGQMSSSSLKMESLCAPGQSPTLSLGFPIELEKSIFPIAVGKMGKYNSMVSCIHMRISVGGGGGRRGTLSTKENKEYFPYYIQLKLPILQFSEH